MTRAKASFGLAKEAELVYQRGLPPQATYTFKHALIRDAAYQSLLKRIRELYHQRIAQVLEEAFPETSEAQPELLAHHYTEALGVMDRMEARLYAAELYRLKGTLLLNKAILAGDRGKFV